MLKFLIFSAEKVNYVFISFLLERIRKTTRSVDTGAVKEISLWGGNEALMGDISAQLGKGFPQSSPLVTVLRRAVQNPHLLVSHRLWLLLFLMAGTSPRKSEPTVFPSKCAPHIPCQSINIFIYRNVCFF